MLAAAAPTRISLSTTQLRRAAPLTQSGASGAPVGPPTTGAGSRSAPPNPASESIGAWLATNDGYRRTFHTVGGDVSFFTAKDAVQVISNTPQPGYTVYVTHYAADSVMVSFFGARKTSRVWVRWWNGPYGEVTESVD
ncbi:hypothetical protein HC031_29560 [Planosporangium thailandense]|uniref:Uncharacterized protein n=1 Tax=Planosporangium thailandense TaxID=765197 RepID=A0ABX0Y5Y8_9ACTN|nr:hypothetical protein [Planosporangium thailandense]NJC73831.1 hypothetical protein [Planosporangium thailandense]